LTEGWDLPCLGAVILARPTKSIIKLLQMTGRVQRPYKGRVPIILDHGNSCISLQVMPGEDIEWSLTGKETRGGSSGPIVKSCAECLVAIPGGCAECPACGALQPKTKHEERKEMEAKLVEVSAARMSEIRARIDSVAREKNAPPGWTDRVMLELGCA
jgi:DNA repair protein RadD